MTLRTACRRALTALLPLLLSGCWVREARTVVLAATTTIEDSGLLGDLVRAFERANPQFRLRPVVAGTGEVLEMGRRKDVDVILSHDPAAESAFVAHGNGVDRREVMYNDFLIAGPPSDPAGIRGVRDAAEAFRRIARAGAPFISRGDDSGTNRKELKVWSKAGITPEGAWYVVAGLGMAEALRVADQRNAYILTDRGTFTTLRSTLRLVPLSEGDPMLLNRYGVTRVAGARDTAGAAAFARWITSPAGQRTIARFGRDHFGTSLFFPAGDTLSAAH